MDYKKKLYFIYECKPVFLRWLNDDLKTAFTTESKINIVLINKNNNDILVNIDGMSICV